MLAYINGKAAGRVGACSQMGPHRFTGAARPGRPAGPAAASPAPACPEPAPLRLSAPQPCAAQPLTWRPAHRLGTGVEWEAPLEAACVLHFESCPYTRWEQKFTHYAATTTSNKNLKVRVRLTLTRTRTRT